LPYKPEISAHDRVNGPVGDLEKEIARVLNRFSAEQHSDTPDFILAAYLMDCLKAFNRASVWRGKWYSPEGVPADERDSGPTFPSEPKPPTTI
jgi:hypothetical protein